MAIGGGGFGDGVVEGRRRSFAAGEIGDALNQPEERKKLFFLGENSRLGQR